MTAEPWPPGAPGVLRLPSGRLVRGRGLRRPEPEGLLPQLGLYLGSRYPTTGFGWSWRWLRWPDGWLPLDRVGASEAVHDVYARASTDRVEVGCRGGSGRTGTVLACLAVLDGVPAADAVGYVRRWYRAGAVETPWQRSYVRRFVR